MERREGSIHSSSPPLSLLTSLIEPAASIGGETHRVSPGDCSPWRRPSVSPCQCFRGQSLIVFVSESVYLPVY